MRQKWLVRVIGWLSLGLMVSQSQTDTSQLICTIPYGTANHQISLTIGAEPVEGDFVDDEYPLLFRRLHTGNFLIVSKRKSGILVQIFTRSGQLQRAYACDESLGSIYSLDADREGMLYCLRHLEKRDLASSESARSLLSIYDSQGQKITNEAHNALLLEKLSSVGFEFPILDLLVDRKGTVYIPISAIPKADDKRRHTPLLICFSPRDGSIEVIQCPGYPTLTPSGAPGFLNFAPAAVAEEQCLRYDGTEAHLIGKDKSSISRFRLGDKFEVSYPNWAFVPKQKHLVLVEIEGVVSKEPYPLQNRRLILLDEDGNQVGTFSLLAPVGSRRLWDTDSFGNIYYLDCTSAGVEIRKVSLATN